MSDSLNNPTPQFGTAEYATKAGSESLPVLPAAVEWNLLSGECRGGVSGLRGQNAQRNFCGRARGVVRALTYGVGAAVVGLIGYALIAILLQGWVISYMSIGVGWIVGTAMMKGSNGVGGRRYQIAAALLTYAAVSLAEIPIWIHFANEGKQQRQTQQQRLADEQRQLEQESGQQSGELQPAPRAERPGVSLGTWLGRLALIGLASPFTQLSGNPGLGANGSVDSFLWNENRVEDRRGQACWSFRTVCLCSIHLASQFAAVRKRPSRFARRTAEAVST